MESLVPSRNPTPIHAVKARPDARPMRFALSAGAIAAMSALATAIVLPPRPPVQASTIAQPQQPQAPQPTADPNATPAMLQVQRPIKYVQLLPGQTPPPGASVIPATAPTPITVVVTVPGPATQQKAAAPAPIIVKTTQSGKVVP